MQTVNATRIVVHIAVIALCGVLGMSAFTVTHSVNATLLKLQEPLTDAHTVAQSVPQELAALNSAIDGLNKTTAAATGLLRAAKPAVEHLQTTETVLDASIDLTTHRLDDLCPIPGAAGAAVRPCGTLADANRTLATLRGTSGQVELSLRMFNRHETDLFTQEATAYAAMNKSVADFDALVSNPDYAAIVANGKTISANAAAATTDGKTYLHQKLFPTKKRGFVTSFEATGDAFHHWMPSIF